MNEMQKERQASIRITLVGDEVTSEWHGTVLDLTTILYQSIVDLIHKNPGIRRKMKTAMRRVWRETRQEWLRYWIDAWPLTLIGAGLIAGGVWAAGQVLHWLGVV